MIRPVKSVLQSIRRFGRKEDGVASIEILFMLPTFFILFMSAFEGGMLSTRHVMLERGVDLAVRDVRIGRMPKPTHQALKEAICGHAGLITNCLNDLQIEMVIMDLRAWDDNELNGPIRCYDREQVVQPAVQFNNGENNELMVLKVCALFNPIASTSTWGRFLYTPDPDRPAGASDLAAGLNEESDKGYALFATTAFVMEPYQ